MKTILAFVTFLAGLLMATLVNAAVAISNVTDQCVFLADGEETPILSGATVTESSSEATGLQATCQWFGAYDPQPARATYWFQDTGNCTYIAESTEVFDSSNVILNVIPVGTNTFFAMSCTGLELR